jgi:hypothetical protein
VIAIGFAFASSLVLAAILFACYAAEGIELDNR